MNESTQLAVIIGILVLNPVIQFLLCRQSILLLKIKKEDVLKTWRVITLSLVSVMCYYFAGVFSLLLPQFDNFLYFLFLFLLIYYILMFIPLRNLSSCSIKRGILLIFIMFVLQLLISILSQKILSKVMAMVNYIK